MAQQESPHYVTRVRCGSCGKSLKSHKPIRVGHTVIRCPRCGHQFRAEAAPVDTPSPLPPPPAAAPVLPRAALGPAAVPLGTLQPGEARPTWQENGRALPGDLPHVAEYTILGELGSGAWGVVYKARHEKLKRVVALKMLLGGPHDGGPDRARFHAEAEAVARLHHPNVVQIFEIGDQNGHPYLALEFVPGGTLKDRLEGQPQPPRAAAQLVEILARAVHAAHQRGIAHRDLKPANILLDPTPRQDDWASESGQPEAVRLYGVPKITDFGLAKRLGQDVGATRQGELLGTPLYMAPEQARGKPDEVGPAADVYALGGILYEMLTGRHPFRADSALALLNQVVTAAPKPPRQLQPRLSRDLETICLKCLAKDPHDRYPSALALADDLLRYLHGEPIRARPASPAARLWSWCLRNPAAASLLLTVTLVLAFGVWQLSRLSDEIVRTQAEKDVEQQTRMLLETMQCYSENVVRWARVGKLEPTHDFRGKKGGIPFPVAFTIELSEQFKRNEDIGIEIRVYSDHRFRFRGPDGTEHLDEWEKDALARLRRDSAQPVKSYTNYKRLASLRYATPLVMRQACVDCHNTHPESQKTDWKPGDVRGVIEVIRPLAGDMEDTGKRLQGIYTFLAGTAAALLAVCVVALRIGKRRQHA